jgi:hypothetical protein
MCIYISLMSKGFLLYKKIKLVLLHSKLLFLLMIAVTLLDDKTFLQLIFI